jgi:hypothetical protein
MINDPLGVLRPGGQSLEVTIQRLKHRFYIPTDDNIFIKFDGFLSIVCLYPIEHTAAWTFSMTPT